MTSACRLPAVNRRRFLQSLSEGDKVVSGDGHFLEGGEGGEFQGFQTVMHRIELTQGLLFAESESLQAAEESCLKLLQVGAAVGEVDLFKSGASPASAAF